jgi:hypothetical protein
VEGSGQEERQTRAWDGAEMQPNPSQWKYETVKILLRTSIDVDTFQINSGNSATPTT